MLYHIAEYEQARLTTNRFARSAPPFNWRVRVYNLLLMYFDEYIFHAPDTSGDLLYLLPSVSARVYVVKVAFISFRLKPAIVKYLVRAYPGKTLFVFGTYAELSQHSKVHVGVEVRQLFCLLAHFCVYYVV